MIGDENVRVVSDDKGENDGLLMMTMIMMMKSLMHALGQFDFFSP